MLIHLASAGLPRERSCIPAFEQLAETAERHHLTDSAEEADVVLFSEIHLLPRDPLLRSVRRTEAYRRHQSKVLVYDESDRPWCAFPGLYVSMPRRGFRVDLQIAWPYYTIGDSPVLERNTRATEADLLFSFVGSPSHRVRQAVYELRHPRAVVERVDGFTFYDPGSPRFEERRANFAELVHRSSFVLCPRGRGTSSIRTYETMAAGRVPVIIGDEWVAPTGLDWESFSIRCPEAQVRDLPAKLESLEADAATMGARARSEYETKLAPARMMDSIGDALEKLQERVRHHGAVRRLGYPDLNLVRNVSATSIAPVIHTAVEKVGRAPRRVRVRTRIGGQE